MIRASANSQPHIGCREVDDGLWEFLELSELALTRVYLEMLREWLSRAEQVIDGWRNPDFRLGYGIATDHVMTWLNARLREMPKEIKPKADFKIKGMDGSGGFVNNPANSKKTLKIILPEKFTDQVLEIKTWTKTGELFDVLKRKTPNEWGNRARYYGNRPIKTYPKDLVVTFKLLDGRLGEVKVKNPQARQD